MFHREPVSKHGLCWIVAGLEEPASTTQLFHQYMQSTGFLLYLHRMWQILEGIFVLYLCWKSVTQYMRTMKLISVMMICNFIMQQYIVVQTSVLLLWFVTTLALLSSYRNHSIWPRGWWCFCFLNLYVYFNVYSIVLIVNIAFRDPEGLFHRKVVPKLFHFTEHHVTFFGTP